MSFRFLLFNYDAIPFSEEEITKFTSGDMDQSDYYAFFCKKLGISYSTISVDEKNRTALEVRPEICIDWHEGTLLAVLPVGYNKVGTDVLPSLEFIELSEKEGTNKWLTFFYNKQTDERQGNPNDPQFFYFIGGAEEVPIPADYSPPQQTQLIPR